MTVTRALRAIALVAPLALSGCIKVKFGGPKAPPPPASGADVVKRMRDRYDGSWFQTLQFTQENTRFLANGRTERSQWKEYMLVPGRLRIEFLPISGGNGAIYADGNVYSFEGGKLARTTPQVNMLLVLTADVYAQPMATSTKQLLDLGVDLSKLRADTLNGRAVWVVGSSGTADVASPQFWIDAETWVVSRVFERVPPGGGQQAPRSPTEYRLGDYRMIGAVPVVHEITLLRDGKPFFKEQYTAVQLNTALDARLFSSSQWRAAGTTR